MSLVEVSMTSAEKLAVPFDHHTGIPLPLVYDPIILASRPVPETERFSDLHHVFYPRALLMAGDIGDQALRGCRVQLVPRPEHNLYHTAYDVPRLPRSDFENFRTIVFSAAGYMPGRAVFFDREGRPKLVPLTPDERARLWGGHAAHIETPDRVRRYLIHYAVQYGLDISPSLMDEFLHAKLQNRRMSLGRELIRLASEEAARPLARQYFEARRKRRLPRDQPQQVGQYISRLLLNEQYGKVDQQALGWLGDALRAA